MFMAWCWRCPAATIAHIGGSTVKQWLHTSAAGHQGLRQSRCICFAASELTLTGNADVHSWLVIIQIQRSPPFDVALQQRAQARRQC
jgi:hypothetical protein